MTCSLYIIPYLSLKKFKQFITWCDAHHLIVKSIGDHSTVFIDNVPINQVTSYKYFAVYIDSSLSWQVHIE